MKSYISPKRGNITFLKDCSCKLLTDIIIILLNKVLFVYEVNSNRAKVRCRLSGAGYKRQRKERDVQNRKIRL